MIPITYIPAPTAIPIPEVAHIPDAVDMLNAGECKEHAISSYRYLIDLTGDPEFFAKHKRIT